MDRLEELRARLDVYDDRIRKLEYDLKVEKYYRADVAEQIKFLEKAAVGKKAVGHE